MAKQKQKLVIGEWLVDEEHPDNGEVFYPLLDQPAAPIAEVGQMVKWARENITDVGSYAFIREVPGNLVIAKQEELKLTFQ